MAKSEPTLVPEWLRNAGGVSGGGSSAPHSASSSSNADVPSPANRSRNRTSKSSGDFDTSRSAFLDRTASSNSRRSSSNGSAKYAYSSFNRGHRDKDREKERERLSFADNWDRDGSDPLGNIFPARVEKDTLRRSHSMVSKRQVEPFPRRIAVEPKGSVNSNNNDGNGVLSGTSISCSIQKAVFDKDFPSLGSEEKQGVLDMGRASSPGLSTAVQSLPIGNSALLGGEGWTSALAEVPTVIGSSCIVSSSVQPNITSNSGSAPPSSGLGLNMAEALAQAPTRARTAPQLSVQTQRLEELAIKQSRQLIPVTPSMPKASVLNSSDKAKPKTPSRVSELNVAVKSGQQQLSSVPQPVRGGHLKPDAAKPSHGKFHVLKPVWENGVSPVPKDSSSPTSNANNRPVNSQPVVAPSAPSSLRSPNNPNTPSVERNPKTVSTLEKRPSLSQVQSRNDFFNLLKKKTSANASNVLSDSGSATPSPRVEKLQEESGTFVSAPVSPHTNGVELSSNGCTSEEVQSFSGVEEKDLSPSAAVYADEEEVAFLRSLGWEENNGEDEGLTEEEINAFYQEYMKHVPSKPFRGVQPKLPMLSESCGANLGGASSSDLGSSGSESEA